MEDVPLLNAQAAFQVDSSAVFREQGDIVPTIVDDRTSYMGSVEKRCGNEFKFVSLHLWKQRY